MIEAVVFDLDDTLYDEVDYCRSALAAVAGYLAKRYSSQSEKGIFQALWSQFAAGNHSRTFNAALDELDIPYDAATIENLVRVYREHKPSITLPDESLDVLRALEGGYSLGLLTDGFLPAQQLKVQALGIERFFECIVYTEALGRTFWKPSPVGFEKMAEALGVAPERMVYVGDNEEKDFVAPNALGFLTVRVRRARGIHTRDAAEAAAMARRRIKRLSELPGLLAGIP
ncbi:MAG TPA: HAD family hydrolase [Phycisphaerales bacterium]|nr:HAD family hydrolase [Phycisphaerales bacterium]